MRVGANGAEAAKSPTIQQQMVLGVKSLAFRRAEKGKQRLLEHLKAGSLFRKLKTVEKLALCLQSNYPKR